MLFGLLLTLAVAGSAYGVCNKHALDKCDKLTRMSHQWTTMTVQEHHEQYCTDELSKCEAAMTCIKADERLYLYQASILGRIKNLQYFCSLSDEDLLRVLQEIECVQKNGLYDYSEGHSLADKLHSMNSCSEYKDFLTESHQAIEEKCGHYIADQFRRAVILWADPMVVAYFDDPSCGLGDWEFDD